MKLSIYGTCIHNKDNNSGMQYQYIVILRDIFSNKLRNTFKNKTDLKTLMLRNAFKVNYKEH